MLNRVGAEDGGVGPQIFGQVRKHSLSICERTVQAVLHVLASYVRSGYGWADLGTFGQICVHMGRSGYLWADLGTYRQMWVCMGKFGRKSWSTV